MNYKRLSSRMVWPTVIVCVLFGVSFLNNEKAHASIFGDIVGVVKDVGSTVGSIVAAPFGGFVDGATAPTINRIENAGHGLIEDADSRVKARIDQIDGRLGARIEQIDGVLVNRIDQLDEVLVNHEDRIDQLLARNIADVDLLAKERIEQLDEIAEKRIGNLDSVAVKAALTMEEGLLRVIGVGSIIVFITIAAWRIWVLITRERQEGAEVNSINDIWAFAKQHRKGLSGQVLGAAALATCLYLLFSLFPGGAVSRAKSLEKLHIVAFNDSLQNYDFQRARYHGSQLQILNPVQQSYRGLTLKADLMRDLFNRPALVKTQTGLFEVEARLGQIYKYLKNDPDLIVLKAYTLWQAGGDKTVELASVKMCLDALEISKKEDFALRELALNYLVNYSNNPAPELEITQSGQGEFEKLSQNVVAVLSDWEKTSFITKSDTGRYVLAENFTPLSHLYEFNSLVAGLREQSDTGYFKLVNAQRLVDEKQKLLNQDGENHELQVQLKDALDARTESAKEVTSAWNDFENRLNSSGALRYSNLATLAFNLNDSIQARARWYEVHPNDPAFAPLMKDIPTDELKMVAPLRVRLATRLSQDATDSPQIFNLIAYDEGERFGKMEAITKKFEEEYVEFYELKSRDKTEGEKWETEGYEVAVQAAALGFRKELAVIRTRISEGTDKNIEDIREKYKEMEQQIEDALLRRQLPLV